MTKPLWAMAEAQHDAEILAKILGSFEETARHPEYGRYGFVGASRVNARTYHALRVAAYLSDWGAVEITQGGLNNNSVITSGPTHNGLGVADIKTRGRSRAEIFALVEAGMDCGVIIFIRGVSYDTIPDGMVPHGHCVTIGGNDKHPSTRAQIYDTSYGYARGGAGLGRRPSARWFGPSRHALVTWERSKYNPANGWRP